MSSLCRKSAIGPAVVGVAAAIVGRHAVTFGSWTWMITPPARIDDIEYSRIDSAPEGGAEVERLTRMHGGAEPADREVAAAFRGGGVGSGMCKGPLIPTAAVGGTRAVPLRYA